jgi:predicted nucleic acid-binding protein
MPGKTLFLDTHGWMALLNSREALHREANLKWQECGRARFSTVVTDWVIAETGNGLARSILRLEFVESVRRFSTSPNCRIVSVTESVRAKALELYAQRSDKSWGLVDCASFIVMSEMGITDAFTTDRHFEQAGFNCLLPASAV